MYFFQIALFLLFAQELFSLKGVLRRLDIKLLNKRIRGDLIYL